MQAPGGKQPCQSLKQLGNSQRSVRSREGKDPVNPPDLCPSERAQWDLLVFLLLPPCLSHGAFIQLPGAGLGCWQILPWGSVAGGSNSNLCHSEVCSAGWCVKHRQLGSVPRYKTELRSLAASGEGSAGCWFLTCFAGVRISLPPLLESRACSGCGVEHLRADCHQAGKSSHCFWAGTKLSAPGTCALHHLGFDHLSLK